jgi:hypothetical protein
MAEFITKIRRRGTGEGFGGWWFETFLLPRGGISPDLVHLDDLHLVRDIHRSWRSSTESLQNPKIDQIQEPGSHTLNITSLDVACTCQDTERFRQTEPSLDDVAFHQDAFEKTFDGRFINASQDRIRAGSLTVALHIP